MNIYFYILSWAILWSGNFLSNILPFSNTSLPIFYTCTLKDNPNKWNQFQVWCYCNCQIRTPYQVISNNVSVLYYTTDGKSIDGTSVMT